MVKPKHADKLCFAHAQLRHNTALERYRGTGSPSNSLQQIFVMFLAKALLSGGSSSGRGGSLARGLGGLLTGGGHGGNLGGLVGGLVNLISEAAAQYNPEPPPPPHNHFTNVEAYESEEIRQFRRLFAQLAGEDMEVCATELRDILNKVLSRHQDLKTDGFSLDTCRSMVAVMDNDTNGKLGFEEFKYLWNNIKKWQGVYKQYDTDQSGTVGRAQLLGALKAAGFHLNEQLCQVVVRRYADEDGSMDFNNFISCLVRLDSMFRAFKSLDQDGDGQIKMTIEDWLQLTMYS
ncbi:calpain small subunit 2 [Podargus strigoides]